MSIILLESICRSPPQRSALSVRVPARYADPSDTVHSYYKPHWHRIMPPFASRPTTVRDKARMQARRHARPAPPSGNEQVSPVPPSRVKSHSAIHLCPPVSARGSRTTSSSWGMSRSSTSRRGRADGSNPPPHPIPFSARTRTRRPARPTPRLPRPPPAGGQRRLPAARQGHRAVPPHGPHESPRRGGEEVRARPGPRAAALQGRARELRGGAPSAPPLWNLTPDRERSCAL